MLVEQFTPPAEDPKQAVELKFLSSLRIGAANEAAPRFLYAYRMRSSVDQFEKDPARFAQLLETVEFGEPG